MATVTNATEWLKDNHLPYLKVEFKGKTVFKFPKVEEEETKGKELTPNLEEAVSFFLANMNRLEAGYYTLKARHNKAWGAGDLYFNFTHQDLHKGAAAAISGLSEDRVGQLIAAHTDKLKAEYETKLKDWKHEREIEDLKKQIKEAKAEKSEFGLDKIREVLGQAVHLVELTKKPTTVPSISGPVLHREPAPAPKPVPSEEPSQTSEETARFGNAITAITKVTGENTIEAFEALAKFAQENPEQFNSYLALLKSQ